MICQDFQGISPPQSKMAWRIAEAMSISKLEKGA
jgi:hypothetical protein